VNRTAPAGPIPWGRALGDALPDALSTALAAAVMFGATEADAPRRELAFALAAIDPGLQFAAAMVTALVLQFRAWPLWGLALGSAAALGLALGPLLVQIVKALPAGHAGDAALLGAWLVSVRTVNAWRRFPDARAAFDDGHLFVALMLPPLQSLSAFALALFAVLALVLSHLGHVEEIPVDATLLTVTAYFFLRTLLHLPPLQQLLRRRLDTR
jgi:hypothetical protein